MSKLGLPFEYGWRRETRLRGINKNGRMIGEVFYYTPTDKRMRSWNDVQKYLKFAQTLHEKGDKEDDNDDKEGSEDSLEKGDEKECSNTPDQEKERSDTPDNEEDKLVIDEEDSSASKPHSKLREIKPDDDIFFHNSTGRVSFSESFFLYEVKNEKYKFLPWKVKLSLFAQALLNT